MPGILDSLTAAIDTLNLRVASLESLQASNQATDTASGVTFGALNIGTATGAGTGAVLAYGGTSFSAFERTLSGTFTSLQAALRLGVKGGTENAGSGPRCAFYGDNSAAAQSLMAGVGAYWINPTSGAETAGIQFQVRANTGDTNAGTLAATLDNTGALTIVGAFGVNGKTAQTAFASGGALAAYATGAFGFDTAAHASALYAMVVAIRAALVADGIMS